MNTMTLCLQDYDLQNKLMLRKKCLCLGFLLVPVSLAVGEGSSTLSSLPAPSMGSTALLQLACRPSRAKHGAKPRACP